MDANDEKLWAHVYALLALQIRVISTILSVAKTPEEARQTLMKMETDTLGALPGMIAGLTPRDRDRMQACVAELLGNWFAGFHMSEGMPKPGHG